MVADIETIFPHLMDGLTSSPILYSTQYCIDLILYSGVKVEFIQTKFTLWLSLLCKIILLCQNFFRNNFSDGGNKPGETFTSDALNKKDERKLFHSLCVKR